MTHLPKKMAGGPHQQRHIRHRALLEVGAPAEDVEAAGGRARRYLADGLEPRPAEDVGLRVVECGSKNAHT